MKKVLILGATGMLGHAVYGVLRGKYDLILSLRNPEKLALLEKFYGENARASRVIIFDAAQVYRDYQQKKGAPGPALESLVSQAGPVDHVVNALGVTIPFALNDPGLTFFVNGAFPHILAGIFGEKLVHITTDCAFSGMSGFPYDEKSPKNPPDLYGLSKSLGEPLTCLTLRTSIIGRELDGFTGLLEWFLKQKGKTLTGFANHFWNGITTKQFGRICDKIFQDRGGVPKSGLFHVFSDPVSKYQMLLEFEKKYRLSCEIKADRENKLNRTLSTLHPLNAWLGIPSFETMLAEIEN